MGADRFLIEIGGLAVALMSMFGQPVCAQSPSGGNLVKALVSRLDLERYKAAEQRAEAGGWWER